LPWIVISAPRSFFFLLHRDHALSVRGDITVIKVLGGGSLVMALPALLGIRYTYPTVKIRLLTTGAVKPFAETLGVFDEILVLDDRSFVGLVTSSLRCLRTCFGNDTVIDLEIYSRLSTVLGIFTCARNRLGFFLKKWVFDTSSTHIAFFFIPHRRYTVTMTGSPACWVRPSCYRMNVQTMCEASFGCPRELPNLPAAVLPSVADARI
jgi:hypothetical protein